MNSQSRRQDARRADRATGLGTRRHWCLRIVLAALLALAAPLLADDDEDEKQPEARVILVGDSTVAPGGGWGDAFARLFAPKVECLNLARNGRSSKSYRAEGHWDDALKKKPDWVLIQFGHNDMPGRGIARETNPKTTYREYLRRYVADARKVGAKPVLVTSLTRRTYNAQGRIDPNPSPRRRGEGSADSLDAYVQATRAVAKALKVPLIDLNARSIQQLNELGPVAAIGFDAKTKNPAQPDKTHLSSKGARATAQLVADEVRKKVPALGKLLRKD